MIFDSKYALILYIYCNYIILYINIYIVYIIYTHVTFPTHYGEVLDCCLDMWMDSRQKTECVTFGL